MSTRTSGGARTGRVLLVVGLLVGALLVVGTLGVDSRDGEPYDPTSTGPEGTKALVELIERFGGRVEVGGVFPVDADVAITFGSSVPDSRAGDVRRWVEEGNTLVLTDPTSELTALADATGSYSRRIARGRCEIAALDGIESIDLGDESAYLRYEGGRGPVCFAGEEGAFVALEAHGRGRIVSLAGASLFKNRHLDEAGNAALATALLAPEPGMRVAVLTDTSFPGAPVDAAPGDVFSRLIDAYPNVGLLLLQGLIALVLLAVVSARRLGRPVLEPQPVQIAGSALVEAVGRLVRQRRDPEWAAKLLRDRARRSVAERSALPADAPPAVLAEVVAARTGRTPEQALAVLDGPPVASDADLVALADNIDTVVEEVTHGRSA